MLYWAILSTGAAFYIADTTHHPNVFFFFSLLKNAFSAKQSLCRPSPEFPSDAPRPLPVPISARATKCVTNVGQSPFFPQLKSIQFGGMIRRHQI